MIRYLLIMNRRKLISRFTSLRKKIESDFGYDYFRNEQRSSCRVNLQDAVASKFDEIAKTRAFEEDREHFNLSTLTQSIRKFHEDS
jgi:hypothetical protein